MRVVGSFRAAIVGLGLAVSLSTGVFAQESTPVPAGEVVLPEECTTAARPVTFLADLIATPVAARPTISEWPAGQPADEAATAAFTEIARELTACSNTGDILRALALYGDDYLRSALNPVGALTPEEATSLLAPYATPLAMSVDGMIHLVEVKNIQVLDDGRISGLVVTDGGPSDLPGLTTDLLIIAQTDDGWIIDDALADAETVLGPAPAE
jgi:hypothetical protein